MLNPAMTGPRVLEVRAVLRVDLCFCSLRVRGMTQHFDDPVENGWARNGIFWNM